jgi:Putative beta-barrel porin-2, OmpL-like. bbp2
MVSAKVLRAALIFSLLAPAFSYGADQPPPAGAPAPAPEGPKPLSPGLLGLEPLIGPIDDAVDNAKAAISKAIGIDVSGFLDVGYQYSSNHPRDSRSITGRYFDKDHNKFIFNNFNMTIEKPEKDWGVGFKIVGDFGRTGELLREATLWSAHLHQQCCIELREAFLTTTIPFGEGIQVKAGKFVTPLGTEILPAPGAYNDNISRSFLFNFAVPLTHTGVLFTYPFTKAFAASAGVVTGWDNPHDNNNSPSFLGGVNITFSDALSLASNMTLGREWSPASFDGHIHDGGVRFVISNVATFKASDLMTVYGEYTLGAEEKALTPGGVHSAWWHGLAGILSLNWTDRFNTAFRGEYFRDADGARTGTRHLDLFEATATAAYKFTAKLLGRAEIRQDVADHNFFKLGRNNADRAQTTFALQGIYTF